MKRILVMLLVIMASLSVVSATDSIKQEGNGVYVTLDNPEDVAYFDVIDENGEVWGTSDVEPTIDTYSFESIEPNHTYSIKPYLLSEGAKYNYGTDGEVVDEVVDDVAEEFTEDIVVNFGIGLDNS